jgi:hypothetical protein
MTTSETPKPIKTIEDLRALEGKKVTFEYEYQAKDGRKKYARPVTRTARTVGTIVKDDRVPSIERYVIQRLKSGNVVVLSMNYRLVKVWN